ncbi:MAG: hypothetical protein EA397_00485 [Deltaproteobacteria bacterium]|nr:MAG: hypothetical protein EA397_00485 [Deltaproteobacteria bacterium]
MDPLDLNLFVRAGLTALLLLSLPACDELTGGSNSTDSTSNGGIASNFSATPMRLFGSSGNDTVSGAVFDGDGNTFVVGQSEGLGHAIGSLYWARLNADGSLGWAWDLSNPDDGEGEGVRVVGDALKGNGPTRAIAWGDDGYLYIAARGKGWAEGSPSFFASYAMKIDPSTGQPLWTQVYRLRYPSGSSDIAANETYGVGITAVGGRVFVAANGGAPEAAVLYELDGSDGALVDSLRINMANPGSASRVMTLVADGSNDSLYLGGWTSANFQKPALAKVDISGSDLAVEWYAQLITPASTHVGMNLSDLDVDQDGNVYAALWVAGTYGWHEVIKLSPDGDPQWGRRWGVSSSGTLPDPMGSQRNDGMLVRVIDGVVYAGGRTGVQHNTWGDTSHGDSVLIGYTTDGDYLSHRYYFSGTSSDVTNIDHLKGIGVLDDGRIAVAGMIWPNASNFVGEWLNIDEVNASGEALTEVPHTQMEIAGSEYTLSKTAGNDMNLIETPHAESRPLQATGLDAGLQVRDRTSAVTADDASDRAPSENAYRAFFEGFLPE